MSLLDDFSRFSAISSVHVFPKMRLMARDHEPDLVAGSGELRVVTSNRFEFTLIGEPENPACGSAWKRDPVSGVIGVE